MKKSKRGIQIQQDDINLDNCEEHEQVINKLQEEWQSYDESLEPIVLPHVHFEGFVRRTQANNKKKLIKELLLFIFLACMILSLSYMLFTEGAIYFIGMQLFGIAFIPIVLFFHFRKKERVEL